MVINEWKYEALSLNSSRKCRCTQAWLYWSPSDELLTETFLVSLRLHAIKSKRKWSRDIIKLDYNHFNRGIFTIFFSRNISRKGLKWAFVATPEALKKPAADRYSRKILNTCFHSLLIALILKSFRFHFRFQSEQNHVLIFSFILVTCIIGHRGKTYQ